MAEDTVAKILALPWVQEQRAAGKSILIIGQSGRIHHADPELARWLGRDELGENAFDLVPPEMAAEGARSMSQHRDLEAYTIWFPMLHGDDSSHWYRWDGIRAERFFVDAICPEPDTSLHHVHVVAG